MSGYVVLITRDLTQPFDVTDAAIEYYTSGNALPTKPDTEFFLFSSDRFTNPVLTLSGDTTDDITIVNDSDQDTNDGLWNTMEADIRSFAELKMGVDDDSNLVASDRDIVKLLNGMIFLLRMTDADEYKNDGLLAHITTSGFTVGDPLNTTMKVSNFYSEVLRELHDSVIGERDTFLDNRLP